MVGNDTHTDYGYVLKSDHCVNMYNTHRRMEPVKSVVGHQLSKQPIVLEEFPSKIESAIVIEHHR